MTKREKVIKGLEAHNNAYCKTNSSETCPYRDEADCINALSKDVHELLEKRVPKLYGGGLNFSWGEDDLDKVKLTIADKLIELGLLKIARHKGAVFTEYQWAIKAVKWDE